MSKTVALVKYWKEVFWFVAVFSIYTLCCQPNYSWSGFDCDLGDFIYSAKYGSALHFPGFPIYSILSWLAIRVPLVTEGWRLAFFMSTIPAIITVILVFLAVRKQRDDKWSPFVASAALAGANVFFMQSIIAEVYAMTALMVTLSYTFLVYEKYKWSAVFGGLTLTMHILAAPAILAMILLNKKFRSQWKLIFGIAIIGYVYLMILALTRESFSVMEGSSFGVLQYIIGTLGENTKWWLSLPIWYLPERIFNASLLFMVAFGLALIPMIKYLFRKHRSMLIWTMIVIPLIYYFGCVVDLASVHLTLAFPFLAIAAGLGIKYTKIPAWSIFGVSVILLVTMPLSYDIGRTLDEGLSAHKLYEDLGDLEEGSIIVNICKIDSTDEIVLGGISGREQTLARIYSKENDHILIPLNISRYASDLEIPGVGDMGYEYREELREEYGIITPYIENHNDNWEEEEYYWILINELAANNLDRDVYYSMISKKRPFERTLTRYETFEVAEN